MIIGHKYITEAMDLYYVQVVEEHSKGVEDGTRVPLERLEKQM